VKGKKKSTLLLVEKVVKTLHMHIIKEKSAEEGHYSGSK
jgi:hypothetical protein